MKQYTLLPSQEEGFKQILPEHAGWQRRILSRLTPNAFNFACFLTFCASFMAGIILALLAARSGVQPTMGPLIGVPSIETLFEYNSSYGEPPSERTNSLWKDLAPPQGGFFRHPDLTPERAGMTVFHQLHCLDALRHALYRQPHEHRITQVRHGQETKPDDDHVYHCIDYLRQTVMCSADTNIEPRIKSLSGVNGFGSVHICRDFRYVKDFVAEWEAFNQTQQTRRREPITA